jgi:L-lactate dehydrogenase (cytochrome)
METDTSERGALLFQLYVPVDKPGAKKLIREARRLKCKALVVTVDSAVIGKREEDDRLKAQLDHEAGIESVPSMPRPKTAPVLRGAHSSTLDWEDLTWIREEWGGAGPIVLKGIQTVEDAMMASKAGVDAIYLSNHGGRQLNYAPSSIRTLLEIRKYCPSILDSGIMEVYLDGGITRGSDVVKALCLGAKAVGIGRPFMYSLSGYGTEGVNRVIESKLQQATHGDITDDTQSSTMRFRPRCGCWALQT